MALQQGRIGSIPDAVQWDDGDYSEAIDVSPHVIKAGAAVNPFEVVILSQIPTPGTAITATAVIADNAVVRGDGGGRGVQGSDVDIDDSGNIIIPDGAYIGIGAAAERLSFDATGYASFLGCNVGIGTTSPDKELHINSSDYSDLLIDGGSTARVILRDRGSTTDYKSYDIISNSEDLQFRRLSDDGDSLNNRIMIFNDDNVGIGDTSPDAKTHIDQSSITGAEPVLLLDQADVSEEFIKFIGSAALADITQSIVDIASVTTQTIAGFLKVFVQDDGNQIADQDYFMPIYTLT